MCAYRWKLSKLYMFIFINRLLSEDFVLDCAFPEAGKRGINLFKYTWMFSLLWERFLGAKTRPGKSVKWWTSLRCASSVDLQGAMLFHRLGAFHLKDLKVFFSLLPNSVVIVCTFFIFNFHCVFWSFLTVNIFLYFCCYFCSVKSLQKNSAASEKVITAQTPVLC